MGRALSRSLAVVALLAVVSATFIVVTPSLARIAGRDEKHHAPDPTWLWQSHVYGDSTSAQAKTEKRQARRGRRPYKPPVARSAGEPAGSTQVSRRQP